MNAERLALVERLFHEALARPSANRAAYLAESCRDDEVRREVESLLSSSGTEDGLLDRVPGTVATEMLAETQFDELEGRTIGDYRILELLGREEIFRARSDGTSIEQLTHDLFRDRMPTWSPDGKRIAFYSNRGGRYDIWSMDPAGGNLERLTHVRVGGGLNTPVWSHDPRRIAYHDAATTCILDVSSSKEPFCLGPIRNATADEGFTAWSWSPNDDAIVGWSDIRSNVGLWAYSFDSRQYERLTDFGSVPVWLRDGRVLFSDRGQLYIYDRR